MNEERKMILEMVKEGKVSVDEGEQLLAALAEEEKETALEVVPGKKLTPKRIIVLVTENGRPKVNVRVPFSLVRVGLKLGKTFGGLGVGDDPTAKQAIEALREMDIDEILDSIADGEISLPYTMVDVDDVEKGEHVSVIIE